MSQNLSRGSATLIPKVLLFSSLALMSFQAQSAAKKAPVEFTPQAVLSDIISGPKWYQKLVMATKTVSFNQVTNTSVPPGTDATTVDGVDLTYFTSNDCTGSTSGGRQILTGGSFTIALGTPFGLNAQSAFAVGNSVTGANIPDMSVVNSIAVVLKSTDNDVSQSNFSGDNYYCAQNVTCSGGECTSAAPTTQNFELKTTAAIGDPADGGVIGCLDPVEPLLNIVVPKMDNSSGVSWAANTATTNIFSTKDGYQNTQDLVNDYPASCPDATSCAAFLCNSLTMDGGYDSDWFLPSGGILTDVTQLRCIYENKDAIGNFFDDTIPNSRYWSSTENANNLLNARGVTFANGQGSHYLVKDFGTSKSPKSTRQRAKYLGRDCPASGTLP